MSTSVFTHFLQMILSSGDVAVSFADTADHVPHWFIKMHMNPQCCSAQVIKLKSSVKKEIGGGGH